MKISLSWLKDFVNLTLSPAALAERLTLAGMEVESINQIGELWDRDKVYVGQILDVKRHPEADRLTLVRVEYGGDAAAGRHGRAQPLSVHRPGLQRGQGTEGGLRPRRTRAGGRPQRGAPDRQAEAEQDSAASCPKGWSARRRDST